MAAGSLPEVETREIPGTDGFYRAGVDGSVWSCHTAAHTRGAAWKRLVPRPYRNGYLCVGVRVNGKRCNKSVQSLILSAFRGMRPDGCQAMHCNDVRTDNRLENLKWGTPRENYDQRNTTGNLAIGERVGGSKLKSDQVREIKSLLASGETQISVGRRFNVSFSMISKIYRGKAWNHIA